MSQGSKSYFKIYMAALVAGLCYVNWWRASTPIDISPVVQNGGAAADPDNSQQPAIVTKPTPSLAKFSETLKRPLFRSDRRPPAEKPNERPAVEETQPVEAATSPDGLRFIGVMRSGASTQRALIRVGGAPLATWVEPGGGIGGWTLKSIETTRVVLQRNGESAELPLYVPNAPAPAAKP